MSVILPQFDVWVAMSLTFWRGPLESWILNIMKKTKQSVATTLLYNDTNLVKWVNMFIRLTILGWCKSHCIGVKHRLMLLILEWDQRWISQVSSQFIYINSVLLICLYFEIIWLFDSCLLIRANNIIDHLIT